jgi:hypothetical protein
LPSAYFGEFAADLASATGHHKVGSVRCVAFLQPVVNRPRSFFATVGDKLEIAGEFVLVFNKFGSTMAADPRHCFGAALQRGVATGANKAPEGFMKIQRRSTLGLPMKGHVSDILHNLARSLFDPYRPELHYMRGPGPKWHAKHDGSAMHGALGLVRVRVKR